MASLEERLRAYNKKSNADPIHRPAATGHADVTHTRLTRHPVSGEPLGLGESVAVDFRNDIATQDLLFFDLESTGLGSSEQTYPFLIGFCRLHGDAKKTHGEQSFEITQCFARTPAGEDEILTEFIRAAHGATLVSFNGKSFDLPLIIRRAEKYGLKANGLRALPHIDLFHLIRRIYPEKPARLADAEERLLGFRRRGDISGAEVAQAYFEFVRFEKSSVLRAIADHNLIDVVTLVSLTARVAKAFEAARSGKTSWAYKIHRDKSAARSEQKTLLTARLGKLDARDLAALGKIMRAEKQYRAAARIFTASYRAGYARAAIDAIRALKRIHGKNKSVQKIARYALAREDERIQNQLIDYLEK